MVASSTDIQEYRAVRTAKLFPYQFPFSSLPNLDPWPERNILNKSSGYESAIYQFFSPKKYKDVVLL